MDCHYLNEELLYCTVYNPNLAHILQYFTLFKHAYCSPKPHTPHSSPQDDFLTVQGKEPNPSCVSGKAATTCGCYCTDAAPELSMWMHTDAPTWLHDQSRPECRLTQLACSHPAAGWRRALPERRRGLPLLLLP